MDPLSGAASVIAVVDITTKVAGLCSKYYSAVKDAKGEIERLQTEVESLQGVLNQTRALSDKIQEKKLLACDQALKQQEQLASQFELLEKKLDPGKREKVMRRCGLRALRWPLTKQDVDKSLEILERFKSITIMALNTDQLTATLRIDDRTSQIQDKLEDKDWDAALSKLGPAKDAAYNSQIQEHEDLCLPETRVDILQQIFAWSEDPNDACIFWLNGMAGTGKSTISRTVAAQFAQKGRLGASFFFSRGRGDLRNATKLFPTISAQLAGFLPTLRSAVSEAVAKHYSTSEPGLSDQWKYLVLEPLSNLEVVSNAPSPMIVIDALDECDGREDVQLILKLLATLKQITSMRIRVFLTSRPETPTLLGFRKISADAHQDVVLHDVPPPIVQHDINVFLKAKLEKIREDGGLDSPWPREDETQLLANRAAGLFIFAATICRFISDQNFDPQEQLSLVIEESGHSPESTSTLELDAIYRQVLEHAVLRQSDPSRHSELASRFKLVVGSVVTMLDVLPRPGLAELLGISQSKVDVALKHLQSVLDVPPDDCRPVRVFHPSFRDFLSGRERCSQEYFWVDEKATHGDLFRCCLRLMSDYLHQDICGLRDPGTSISSVTEAVVNKSISQALQYACRYWVEHFQRGSCKPGDHDLILAFLQQHLLHWLEVLSLLGKVNDAIILLANLAEKITKLEANEDLSQLISDSSRLVRYYRFIIEEAPLQLYCSALLFSPEQSTVRKQYDYSIPCWIQRRPKVNHDWSPSLQVLQGHSSRVNAVAFSPDGKLVASGSGDETVRMWNINTGTSLNTLNGHSSWVLAVAFSPDGNLVASASHDNTVRLWDADTGVSRSTFDGHSSWVLAVAFSPDGKLVASASRDSTVRLWDTDTRASRSTLHGHSSLVNAVAFSPDGKLVASASHDGKIGLWDVDIGALRSVLDGHSSSVLAVACSPDGKLVASGSWDSTVRLWDINTGTLRSTLDGHSSAVSKVAFSPDGKLVASASNDNTVRLWDADTGVSRSTLHGHSSWVLAVAFSPDGKLVASTSHDNTVRLWSTDTGVLRSILDGHLNSVLAVAFSPDGKLMASASHDKTIRLWDTQSGETLNILSVSSSIKKLQFSNDSSQLHTNRGIVSIPLSAGASCGVMAHTNSSSPPFVVDDWISLREHNFVWLPPEHRPSCVSTWGDLLVMGHPSGQVTFMSLDSAYLFTEFG